MSHKNEAVEATVLEKAYIAAEDALRSDMWDGDPENIPPNMRTEAELAVDAAAPIIRADERRRVAEAIAGYANKTALIDLSVSYQGYYQGLRSGLQQAVEIAERSGK